MRGLSFSLPIIAADGVGTSVRVFTTRPETLAGATFLVLAPEHPLVKSIVDPVRRETVGALVKETEHLRGDRTAASAPGAGEFTGVYARNPLTGADMPVYVAPYVLLDYGTGAIMAVPAHDERDFAFAVHHDLPIVPVVAPTPAWLQERAAERGLTTSTSSLAADVQAQQEAYLADPASFGAAFSGRSHMLSAASGDSLELGGKSVEAAAAQVTQWAVHHCEGVVETTYRLRD